MAHIFTAPKGQTITLDDIHAKRPNANFGDKAIVLHKGEFFVAEFTCTIHCGYAWAIRHQYGFKNQFAAMIECEGVVHTDNVWLRANNCVTV